MTKLDYSLETPEERKKLVEKILTEVPDPSPQYLEILANYLILGMEKQEKKEKKIITENRLVTINKREKSFEGLVSQFTNGEDGVYSLLKTEGDKNVLFQPKISITKKDIEEVPSLKELRETISIWEKKLKTSEGHTAYLIKKALIEMRKDQYVLKQEYNQPINIMTKNASKFYPKLDDSVEFSQKGESRFSGVTCVDPRICQTALCNYTKLKQASYGKFESDLWCFMYDFDLLLEKALKDQPMYQRIVECKIQGMSNEEIKDILQAEFNKTHTVEYISSLWRRKIPKLIASVAEDECREWYFLNVEKGIYKKCSCCGQIKLAHNRYFSKNRTSKDGFYSLCKDCRNSRARNKRKG